MALPYLSGRLKRRDGTQASRESERVKDSNSSGVNKAEKTQTEWLENKSKSARNDSKIILWQPALAFAGENGTGMATPRGPQAPHSTSSTSKNKSNLSKANATLDSWVGLLPAAKATRSAGAAHSDSRPIALGRSPSGSERSQSREDAVTKKQPSVKEVVLVPEETQVVWDNDSVMIVERDIARQAHVHSAEASEPDVTDGGQPTIVSRADCTEESNVTPRHSPVVSVTPDAAIEKVPAQFHLPPMPTPHPGASDTDFDTGFFDARKPSTSSSVKASPPTTARTSPMTTTNTSPIVAPKAKAQSTFCFGGHQRTEGAASSKIFQRKRAIIESSSSPTKVLVGPSSSSAPSPPLSTAKVYHCTKSQLIFSRGVTQPEHNRQEPAAVQKATTMPKQTRPGSRVPWDSDDESEKRRLNRTESEILVQEELVRKRKPREAPLATQERTDYMDRYRSESYSPVQYTATEGHMNEFRARLLGLSPRKRAVLSSKDLFAQPTSHSAEITQGEVRMDLEEDSQATELSDPPTQAPATGPIQAQPERATYDITSSVAKRGLASAFLFSRGADDSGYGTSPAKSIIDVKSSSPPKAVNDDHNARLLCELFPEENEVVAAALETSARSVSARAVPRLPAVMQAEEKMDEVRTTQAGAMLDEEDADADTDDSSDFDESTIFKRPRERIILAMPSQETCPVDTQFIIAEETQYVRCSQDLPEEDVEDDEESWKHIIDQRQARLPVSSKAANERKSISHQIKAAWLPAVMPNLASSKEVPQVKPVQSALTDFYRMKPGGPSERAAAEEQATQIAFAKAALASGMAARIGGGSSIIRVRAVDDDDDDDIQEMDAKLGPECEGHLCVEDSDDEDPSTELGSQFSQSGRPVSCEGWVLGKRKHKTPTPVKQFRYRQF